MALKTGISGLRGTVAGNEPSLTPDIALAWARAWASLISERAGPGAAVALGRDGRRSSPMLADLVRTALLSSGLRVYDLGLSLTPTVQFTVSNDPALAGGVMITASHNPVIWNGLKFLDERGRFLPLSDWDAMQAIITSGQYTTVPLDALPPVSDMAAASWQAHLNAVLAALHVPQIQQRRLRVALDACNSGAARWLDLLAALGCEALPLNTEQTGFFAREAEPLPQHLGTLAHLVRVARCDLGLAADPDGDRLVLVDERGDTVSEEHTVVLCARERLAAGAGQTVVVNLVTTHAIEDAFPQAEVRRTAVGEMNVVDGVCEASHPALGGEGSGGIIVPGVNLARDGAAAAGLILSLLARTNQPLSALVDAIPPWHSLKTKLTITHGDPELARQLFTTWQSTPPQTVELRAATSQLQAQSQAGTLTLTLHDQSFTLALEARGATMRAEGPGPEFAALFTTLAQQAGQPPASHQGLNSSFLDGVKVWTQRGWLSLRPSNTEPILRVMGEIKA
jgi:phosphomannomutase